MNNYLIPIALAWQELQPKNQHFYRLDVLPAKIMDGQKRFKLAWHGVLLLLMLFVAVTALTVIGLQKQAEISSLNNALEFDKRQMEEQKIIVDQISMLEERSTAIRSATTTLDTLLLNAELWTETLDTLSIGAAALRDTWVSEMKLDKEGDITVIGYAVQRTSIPDFSESIGTTVLREVTVQEIGEHKVYRYEIMLRPDSLYPYSGSRASRWHDSIRTALGDVIVTEQAGSAAPTPGVSAAPQPQNQLPAEGSMEQPPAEIPSEQPPNEQ
jgi:hypothetical protein